MKGNQQLALELRDQALHIVLQNAGDPWRDRVLAALRAFAAGQGFAEFIFEDFRVWWFEHGGEAPHHHNAWGAISSSAVRQRIIYPANRLRHMSTARSHGRRSMLYRGIPS